MQLAALGRLTRTTSAQLMHIRTPVVAPLLPDRLTVTVPDGGFNRGSQNRVVGVGTLIAMDGASAPALGTMATTVTGFRPANFATSTVGIRTAFLAAQWHRLRGRNSRGHGPCAQQPARGRCVCLFENFLGLLDDGYWALRRSPIRGPDLLIPEPQPYLPARQSADFAERVGSGGCLVSPHSRCLRLPLGVGHHLGHGRHVLASPHRVPCRLRGRRKRVVIVSPRGLQPLPNPQRAANSD